MTAETKDPLPPYSDPKGRKILARHKRLAMRQARKMGLKPETPNEALYKLAELGVNVFAQDESVLDMAGERSSSNTAPPKPQGADATGAEPDQASDPADPADPAAGSSAGLPAAVKKPVVPAKKAADQMAALTEEEPVMDTRAAKALEIEREREIEVARIQRELVRRRRQRVFAMMLRLLVFVLLPTAAVGYYYFQVASDMYATDSEFVIQSTDASSGVPNVAELLTGGNSSQDSTVVQGYLTSREAFLRLQNEFDFVEHFKNPEIDAWQRLPEDATIDDGFGLFKRNVIVGYDPAEGVIRMTVIASTPEDSQAFSEALVRYAEDRVDSLTLEARGDQLDDALARRDAAEADLLAAQRRIVNLQSQLAVLSPEAELASKMAIINSLQLELETRRLELRQILANARPNQSRADVLRAEIQGYEERINELRSDLTQTGGTSLAAITAELQLAELDLATRQMILQETIAGAQTAQSSANQQTRYISVSVAPIAPVEASYPRKVESTVLSFLVFSGIYIMLSLTFSILREQVSL